MGWYSTIRLKITLKDSAQAIDLNEVKSALEDETFLEMIDTRYPEICANPNVICDVTVSQQNELIHIEAVYKYGEHAEVWLLCMACKELFKEKAVSISGGFARPDMITIDPRDATDSGNV